MIDESRAQLAARRPFTLQDVRGAPEDSAGLQDLARGLGDAMSAALSDFAGHSFVFEAADKPRGARPADGGPGMGGERLLSFQDVEETTFVYLRFSARAWAWILDRSFGGAGVEASAVNPEQPSRIESVFIRRLSAVLSKPLTESLFPAGTLFLDQSALVESIDPDKHTGQFVCIDLPLTDGTDCEPASASMLLPLSLVRSLAAQVRGPAAVPPRAGSATLTQAFARTIEESTLEISAVIEKRNVPLSALLKLSVGDSLELRTIDGDFIRILANNTPICTGHLRQGVGRYSVVVGKPD